MRVGKTRLLAATIVTFAGLDLMFLIVAPIAGWIEIPAPSVAPGMVALLALAFFFCLVAVIGATTILATDWASGGQTGVWEFWCHECGRSPDAQLSFCQHCGARV